MTKLVRATLLNPENGDVFTFDLEGNTATGRHGQTGQEVEFTFPHTHLTGEGVTTLRDAKEMFFHLGDPGHLLPHTERR